MFNSQVAYNAETFSLETPVLTTERLVLRPPMIEDAEDLAAIANLREIAEMTRRMPHPYTISDANAFIGQVINSELQGHIYAVTLADTGHLIGMTSVERRAHSEALEVGYWLGRKWWGKGYASEACTAVVDLAFRVTGADVIYAATRPINAASRQVLVKQGFTFVGNDEIDTLVSGRVAVERYRLTRDGWLETRATSRR
ncbi:MAG: GNAT family N-acetyltransferase [Pseudomonadota bacterium]